MNYVLIAIIIILAVAATVFFDLWQSGKKTTATMTQIASTAAEEKKAVEYDRDWYRDESLRLQGAVERLSKLVYGRARYEKLLTGALDMICLSCGRKNDAANDATGIPDACIPCNVRRWKNELDALKGAHSDGTDGTSTDNSTAATDH